MNMEAALFAELRELRGDLKSADEVLVEFAGKYLWQKAQNAVEHIAYLRRELNISKYNERAAHDVCQQALRELEALRKQLNQRGVRYGEEARQAQGTSGPQQERTCEEDAREIGREGF